MKRIFTISGLVFVAIVAILASLAAFAFSGRAPIRGGARVDGVEVVKDGFVSACIVDLGPGEVALVDAGNDKQGKEILAALARRGLGPEAVKAVLLTHGDPDHVAAVPLFRGAQVMALAPEADSIEGRAQRKVIKWMGRPHDSGIRVNRALQDGESVTLKSVTARVFAVPGHTPGSAAFLIRGVLFLGDSADINKDRKLQPGPWLFTADPARNRESLRQLRYKLTPFASEIRAINCAHSGMKMGGLALLVQLTE
jgi:glyoxylase-like metal-dependent hydrolase (beta-lactamase superfamily II)